MTRLLRWLSIAVAAACSRPPQPAAPRNLDRLRLRVDASIAAVRDDAAARCAPIPISSRCAAIRGGPTSSAAQARLDGYLPEVNAELYRIVTDDQNVR